MVTDKTSARDFLKYAIMIFIEAKKEEKKDFVWMWELHISIAQTIGAKYYKDALIVMAKAYKRGNLTKAAQEGAFFDKISFDITEV